MSKLRGVRGAISVEVNEREAILSATEDLLLAMVSANGIDVDDVSSVMFSTTNDLDAEFPALAARRSSMPSLHTSRSRASCG